MTIFKDLSVISVSMYHKSEEKNLRGLVYSLQFPQGYIYTQ